MKTQRVDFYLYLPTSLLNLINSKHDSPLKFFNSKGSPTSEKLNTTSIIFSSTASVNSPASHPGLHMAEPVQSILY